MKLSKIMERFDKSKRALKLRTKIQRGGVLSFPRKIAYNRICDSLNCFVPPKVEIGENIIFPHGLTGIFISQGAVIGDDCTIFHQVTIGSNTIEDSKAYGAPKIGNNVYIGAGAKIVGNVCVGNNVRIGANAVVTIDIPDNTTVVMEKPRLISHAYPLDNHFKSFKA
ncbi:MAG: serine acetyltransferase [Oscillospiraceae bacterium]|nr:serine acetyltransferase [Oscillospiraceae bacterium]